MTRERLKSLFRFMSNTWPGKVEWVDQEVFDVWYKALTSYSDDLVGLAVVDLMKSPQRDQQWPFLLPEITQQAEKTRKAYDAMGFQL